MSVKIDELRIYDNWRESHAGLITEANLAFIDTIKDGIKGETAKYVTSYITSSGEMIVDIKDNAPAEYKEKFWEVYNAASDVKDNILDESFNTYKQEQIEQLKKEQETIPVQRIFDADAAVKDYVSKNVSAKEQATKDFEKKLSKMSLADRKALEKAGFSYTIDSQGNVNISYSSANNLSDKEKQRLKSALTEVNAAATSSFNSYQQNMVNYKNDAENAYNDKYNSANNNMTCNISKADAEKFWNENYKDKYEADIKALNQKEYAEIMSSDLDDSIKSTVSIGSDGKLKIDKSKLTSKLLADLKEITDDYDGPRGYKSQLKSKYDTSYKDSLGKAAGSGYFNEKGEDANTALNDADAVKNDVKSTTSTNDPVEVDDLLVEDQNEAEAVVGEDSPEPNQMHTAWDPRLYRIDSFLLGKSEQTATGLGGLAQNAQIPFGSHTVNSAFYDYAWNIESAVKNASDSKFKNTGSSGNILPESTNEKSTTQSGSQLNLGSMSNKEMVNSVTDFQENSDLYGAASLMNSFTLTKLVGGLNVNIGSKKLENFMFDIRDLRRFYDSGVNGNNAEFLHASSNPTVSLLINWGNSDKWGRTPYTYQDFVFSEWFGKIPNNRLITLRRYTAPTYDNLNFENMYGEIEDANHSQILPPVAEGTGSFAPVSTVITYFGSDTGNTLSSLMNFTTGTKWKEIKSDVYTVDGDEGTNPQAKVDEILENGTGFGGQDADQNSLNSLLGVFGNVAGRVVSFGKMTMAMKDNVGIDEKLQMQMYQAQNDPYEGVFKNRILGPINRIQAVQGREAGIEFTQTFSIICSYKSKAISGINPKAALLDVLGNCLSMASPTAVFWGGAYKFQVIPHAYPFHDGGWRDSFMKKIYDGNFLGNDGAIATLASGIKNVCSDENGNVTLDSILQKMGSLMGDGLAILGSAINSVTALFGGSGNAGDFLTNAAGSLNNKDAETNKEAGEKAVTNLFNNLQNMWHNRALKESTLPRLKTGGSILTGEPTGEWHMTIGNPLNPIMVVGNLICKSMSVTWDDELGPDDFPTGFKVTYTVEHAMARDNDAIQSMFNRGMGKFYVLPDYIQYSSDRMTHVDAFTQDESTGDVGTYNFYNANAMAAVMTQGGVPTRGYNLNYYDPGVKPSNSGNYKTQLITKFTPLPSSSASTLDALRNGNTQRSSNLAVIVSKSANRKLV